MNKIKAKKFGQASKFNKRSPLPTKDRLKPLIKVSDRQDIEDDLRNMINSLDKEDPFEKSDGKYELSKFLEQLNRASSLVNLLDQFGDQLHTYLKDLSVAYKISMPSQGDEWDIHKKQGKEQDPNEDITEIACLLDDLVHAEKEKNEMINDLKYHIDKTLVLNEWAKK